jgi:hypothetical protein
VTKVVHTSGVSTGTLQDAFDAAAGGVLELHGYFPVTALVDWTQPCKVDAKDATIIATGCGGIRLSPDPSALVQKNMWELIGAAIVPSVSGGPGYGIDIALGLGQWLSKLTIKGCTIGQFAGAAIHQKKVGDPDGLFCSLIEDNILIAQEGGLAFEGAGDSIIVQRNTITGPGFGVYEIGVPGAAQRVYQNNNVTAQAGAFILQGSNQTKIINNQIEAVAYTGALDAMIYLDPDCHGCDVKGNNLNSHGNCTPLVVAGKANNFDDNDIYIPSSPAKPHLRIVGGDPTNNFKDSNRCYVNGAKVPPLIHLGSVPTTRKRVCYAYF